MVERPTLINQTECETVYSCAGVELGRFVDSEYVKNAEVCRGRVVVWRFSEWRRKLRERLVSRRSIKEHECVTWRDQEWIHSPPEDVEEEYKPRDKKNFVPFVRRKAPKNVKDRTIATVLDEERYWEVVNGVSLSGKGTPTIPKGEVLSSRMWQYHCRLLTEDAKERLAKRFAAWQSNVVVEGERQKKDKNGNFVRSKAVSKRLFRLFASGQHKPAVGQMRLEFNLCGRRWRPVQVVAAPEVARQVGHSFMDGVKASIEEMLSDFEDFGDEWIKSIKKCSGDAVKWFVEILKKGVAIHLVMSAPQPIEHRLLGVYSIIHPQMDAIPDAIAGGIFALVKLLRAKEGVVEGQSAITNAAKALFGFSLDKEQESIMRQYVMGTKIIGGVADTMKHLLSFFKPWLRKMWLDTTGCDLFPDELSDILKEIQTWNSYCSAVVTLLAIPSESIMTCTNEDVRSAVNEHKLPRNHFLIARDFMLKYRTSFRTLEDSCRPLMRDRNNVVSSMMGSLTHRVGALNTKCLTMVTNSVERYAPMAVMLTGRTGQGKTFSSNILIKLVLKMLGFDFEGAELAYSRNQAQDHWDGYVGQPVTQFEEFGAIDDSEQMAKTCSDFLQMIGDNSFHLPMAALEDKNMTFRSVLVLATTNIFGAHGNGTCPTTYSIPRPIFSKVTSPAAVMRRFKYMVHVVQNERIDVGGANAEDKIANLCRAWSYYPYTFVEDLAQGGGEWRRLLKNGEFVVWNLVDFAKQLANDIQASVSAPINTCATPDVIDLICKRNIEGQSWRSAVSAVSAFGAKLYVNLFALRAIEAVGDLTVREERARLVEKVLYALREHAAQARFTEEQFRAAVASTRFVQFTAGIERGPPGRLTVYFIRPNGLYESLFDVNAEGLEGERLDVLNIHFAGEVWCLHQTRNAWDWMKHKITKHKVVLQGATLGAGVAWLVSWLLRRRSRSIDTIIGQLYPTEKKQVVRAKAGPSRTGRAYVISGQSNYSDVMFKPKDVYQVSVDRGDGSRVFAQGFFVKGRVFVTNYHTFSHLFTNDFSLVNDKSVFDRTYVTIDNGQESFTFKFSELSGSSIWGSEGVDVLIFNLGAISRLKSMGEHKDMTDHFVTQRDVQNHLINRNSLLCMYRTDDNQFRTSSGNLNEWHNFDSYSIKSYIGGEMQLSPAMARVDGIPGSAGMCGAPYMGTGPAMSRRYVGIHVAGCSDKSCGYVSFITQELLREAFDHLCPPVVVGHSLTVNKGQERLIKVLSENKRATDIVVGVGPGSPNQSTIFPTFLNDRVCGAFSEEELFRSKKGPAMLKSNGEIFPMEIALSTMRERTCDASQDEVFECANGMHTMFAPASGLGDHPRVITFKDVLTPGGTKHPHITSVDMSTSMGHRFSMFNVGKRLPGKRSFFRETLNGSWEPYGVGGEFFMTEMGELFRKIDNGGSEFDNVVWDDCLKDEKRSLSKVASGSTRLFMIGEAHVQIAIKMLVGYFAGSVIGSHHHTPVKLGMNVFSSEWADFFRTLTRGDEKGNVRLFAGDYSGWDKNIDKVFIRGFFRVVRNWYETYAYTCVPFVASLSEMMKEWGLTSAPLEFHKRFVNAVEDGVVTSRHCAFGVYYTVSNIIPSGHALTSVMNSICNLLVFDCAYRRREGRAIYNDCVLGVVGDDNVCSLLRSDSSFSCSVMAEECEKLGFTYTDFEKGVVSRDYHSPLEIEFVKRKFVEINGLVRAPLNWDSMAEMIMWKHGKVDCAMALGETLRTFSTELVEYGVEFYNKVRNIVHAEIAKDPHRFPPRLFEESFPVFGTFSAERRGESRVLDMIEKKQNGTAEISQSHIVAQSRVTAQPSNIRHCLGDCKNSHDLGVGFKGKGVVPLPRWLNHQRGEYNRFASIDEKDGSVVTGITNFVQEEASVIAPEPHVMGTFDPYPDQGVSTILSRPYQVDTLTWSGAAASGTGLALYQFPNVLFNEANIWAKLQRFMFFKADVVVSMRINATRFHYGTLLVSWLPNYDPANPLTEVFPQYKESKFGNLYTQSCNTSMVLSANASEPVEFTIPCVIPIHTMSLDRYLNGGYNFGLFGCVVVRVLTPLGIAQTTSTPVVDIAVTANFTNVQVSGMCSGERIAWSSTVNTIGTLVGQSKVTKEAKEKSSDKLVSGVALSASNFFAGLQAVPLIGATAGVLSTAFKFVGAGARAIGFDKPTTVESTTTVAPRVASDMCAGEGLDLSQKLTLMPDAMCGRLASAFGGDNDTSIAGVSRRLSIISVLAVNASAEVGALIAGFPVTPMLSPSDEISTVAGWSHPTLGAHIGRFFQWWRGSMRYSIRFVCSSYTTCRVRIGWHPIAAGVPTDLGIGAGDYISRVVDINGDTTVDFSIPYLQSEFWSVASRIVPWKKNTGVVPWCPEGYANGAITISIVNPVRSAENTSAATVNIVIFSSIAADMQFSGPRTVDSNSRPLIGQSRVEIAGARFMDVSAGFDSLIPSKGAAIDSGIGVCESIRDLKDYCKRYHFTQPNESYSSTSWNTNKAGAGLLSPGSTNIIQSPLNIGPMGRPNWVNMMSIFMFYRGGFRYKFLFSSTTGDPACSRVYVSNCVSTDTTSNSSSGVLYGSTGSACTALGVTPEVSVEVPYYVPYAFVVPSASVCRNFANTVNCFFDGRGVSLYNASYAIDAAFNVTYSTFCSAADDCDFGVLCAPPSVYLSTVGLPVLTPGQWPW